MKRRPNSGLMRFNPRTYIRYDSLRNFIMFRSFGFNPRTYIRYDVYPFLVLILIGSFNPRTYIRYDGDFAGF